MNRRNEKELIQCILEGNPEAFSVLLKLHQDSVHTLILQIVSSQEDAEELTQDVFMKAYQKIGTFRGDAGISTWLYRIAYNTAISATRKKKQVTVTLDEKLLNGIRDDEVDEILDREEDERLLEKMETAIKKLKPEERALLSLYYNQEKPINEIAIITQLTPSNVKIKLFRIRKKVALIIQNFNHVARQSSEKNPKEASS